MARSPVFSSIAKRGRKAGKTGSSAHLKAEERGMEWGKGNQALNEGVLELFGDDPELKRKAQRDMQKEQLRNEMSMGSRRSHTDIGYAKGGAVTKSPAKLPSRRVMLDLGKSKRTIQDYAKATPYALRTSK